MLKINKIKTEQYDAEIFLNGNLITSLKVEAKDKDEAAEKAGIQFRKGLKINIVKSYD